MATVYELLPEIEPEEIEHLRPMFSTMDDAQQRNFANIYRSRRKDPKNILIFAILGFFGIAGIHRLMVDQIGMGILYLLTAGLCFIGTIVDLVNYKSIAFEYNLREAERVRNMVAI